MLLVNEESDLGVIVQNCLKVDKQCAKTLKSANSNLGMIRSFINKHTEIIVANFLHLPKS